MDKAFEDLDLFMMCDHLNAGGIADLPAGYYFRLCRPEELNFWKRMPFDDPQTATAFEPFMTDFFDRVYQSQVDEFFKRTFFACNPSDEPVGTCMLWKAHDAINTIHWLKVLKTEEGKGIGRALLSFILKDLPKTAYPIYLHTQAGSYRALKLYADFGFCLLTDPIIGPKKNELHLSLPWLKQQMPNSAYQALKFKSAPSSFLQLMSTVNLLEF